MKTFELSGLAMKIRSVLFRWSLPVSVVMLTLLAANPAVVADELAPGILWSEDGTVPKASEVPLLKDVQFVVIKKREPDVDGYDWLHGVAIARHKGRLYSCWGHNEGLENTATEVVQGRYSDDDGMSWSPVFMISSGDSTWAISHGVFLSRGSDLWAFLARFRGVREDVRTEAFVLDEATGKWHSRGIVAKNGFWPMQEPQRMDNGCYLMAGIQIGGRIGGGDNPAAVAISQGNNLTKWDVVPIPKPRDLNMWGESTVLIDGSEILNIARWASPVALMSISRNFGRDWTETCRSNLPMTASKPYAGTLSNGQRYLICTTTSDAGNRRFPLTIAVTGRGSKVFRKMFRIRDGIRPGETADKPAALAYPYAIEDDGRLFVAYSAGRLGGNRNDAELAIIPVGQLEID